MNILCEAKKNKKYIRSSTNKRGHFPKRLYHKRNIRGCTVLPVRNLLFEQDSDIRVSNLFAGIPRVVER